MAWLKDSRGEWSSGRRFCLVFFSLLVVLVGYAYANSLTVGFVFDDTYGIEQNPSVRSLANIPRYFVDPFLLTTFRDNVDVRPVLQITFAVNYAISRYAPWSWHLFNIFVHLITATLIFHCVRDHCWWPRQERGPNGFARWPAAATALFFALAPLNQQALVYMWARSALLCTCFYLAGFLLFLEKRRKLAALFFLLALLTKTIAVTLPLILLVYDFLEQDALADLRRWPRRAWQRFGKAWLVLLAVLVLFLVYRAILLPSWADKTRHEAFVTPWVWLMSQWTAYLYYVRLFFWPDALAVDHDFPYNITLWSARTLCSLAGILTWIGLALTFARKQATFAFATAWYFLTLAPESTLAPLAEVINDHRPYLGSALGLSLLAGWGLSMLARRLPRPAVAMAVVTGLLCLAAVPVVRQRNWLWQNSRRLWVDTAEKNPRNGRALMNAGLAMMSENRLKEARQYYNRALWVAPAYTFLHMNLSVLENAEGKPQDSLREAQIAVALAPRSGMAHQYLGFALQRLDRKDEAKTEFERAMQFDPGLTNAKAALDGLGLPSSDPDELDMSSGLDALYQNHDPATAATFFRKVLSRNPRHYGATYQLAAALDQLGQSLEAVELWRKVLSMAEGYHDGATAETARNRLGKKP